MNSIPLIQTKLMIPTTKHTDLRRAKLTKKLKTINSHPLTIVHAGAGYGKSTAMALYVIDEKCSCCWYSISAMDDDILPFLTYLVASIRTSIPQFGREMEAYIKEMDRYIREQELHLLCSIFINEILAIKQELLLILDDFQQIEHSYNVNRWMELLLEHIPSNLHLIVISRSRPAWKPITRMKANRLVLEVTKDDLMLSKEEVELLLNEIYEMTLPQAELDQIYQLTEGWVIALGMIAGQTENYQHLRSGIYEHSRSLKELFHYLAMEVFAKQEPEIQSFLEQTSILVEMNEGICNAILGIEHSKQLLERLTAKNLFIQKMTDKDYRYHALFREFLEKQLRSNSAHAVIGLHERAALFFQNNQMLEEALIHYEKINQTKAIASLLETHGLRLLVNGKLEGLLERLTKIPEANKQGSCTLWFLQGEIHRYRSSYKEAEVCYQRAIEIAELKHDVIGKSKALEGKARIYLDTIQPNLAERLLYEAIELLEQDELHSKAQIASLYQLLAENLINLGHGQKAEKWLNRAKLFNVPLDSSSLEARLYLRTGKFTRAKQILHLTREAEQASKSSLPQSHRETELLLSIIAAFTGEGEKAKELAQEGIHHGLKMKAPFVEACGWIRMGHAVQLLNRYDSTLAIECYETALEIMESLHVEKGKAESLMGLCYLYGTKGEYHKALEVGKLALQETERVKDHWLSGFITLSIGIATFYSGRTEEALAHFQRGDDMFLECNDDFGQMLSHFWLAYSYYQLGNHSSFSTHFLLFLQKMEYGRYEFFLSKRTLFGPNDLQVFAPLLIEAQKQQIPSPYVPKLLKEMNLIRINSHPGYSLRVKALGQFRVWLGEKEVESRSWQRGKAKELFQLFITNKHKLIPKEEIYQILWPEQTEANAARDFKVALNALNHVLEPNRKARANSFFILREGVCYGLNPNAGLEIDTTFFEHYMMLGLEEKDMNKALNYLIRGLDYYGGDFLPDRLYEDWCVQERERLLNYFLRGAEKLAQACVRNEDYDSAIEWCLKIISHDCTWEEAYRLLMYSYFRKNNRPQAIKWFRKCKDILEQELGVSPMEPTVHMYEMILEAEID
ncbi:BTAD domain-containing putative transcriptional regulator [Bacillus marasmi]|uniref:BTAD domain-containing putative transcriptional regulator n=1 Tax=Bacillus marasmi TaxID=1926279 RepID=UPI0011C93EB1|nr:BTAD domain-containing putative transcriptional regulator [Bacillus marasmi]